MPLNLIFTLTALASTSVNHEIPSPNPADFPSTTIALEKIEKDTMLTPENSDQKKPFFPYCYVNKEFSRGDIIKAEDVVCSEVCSS